MPFSLHYPPDGSLACKEHPHFLLNPGVDRTWAKLHWLDKDAIAKQYYWSLSRLPESGYQEQSTEMICIPSVVVVPTVCAEPGGQD